MWTFESISKVFAEYLRGTVTFRLCKPREGYTAMCRDRARRLERSGLLCHTGGFKGKPTELICGLCSGKTEGRCDLTPAEQLLQGECEKFRWLFDERAKSNTIGHNKSDP